MMRADSAVTEYPFIFSTLSLNIFLPISASSPISNWTTSGDSIPRFTIQIRIPRSRTSDGIYLQDGDGMPATTKEENKAEHGIGLRRIADIAEKAGGFLKILPEKDRFTLCVLLPLEDGDSI